MLPVSLDCQFVVASSVFSNFYVTISLVIEVHVPTQKIERSYICVLSVSNLPLSIIFLVQ